MTPDFRFGPPEVQAVMLATVIIAVVAMIRYWNPPEST
jgi:hypothetical protein